jgi:acyl-CoA synthetase (NDP forming)
LNPTLHPDAARSPLQRLLAPRSIAVIGGEVAAEVIRQCRKIGYPGTIRAVSASRARIEGVDTVARVADLPEAPDAAFVAVRREETVAVVEELARRGAHAAVCYASGFAEVGGDGIELQRRLVRAAGAMALLGPNCYGLVNYLDGCALWPDHIGGERVARGVAIITQSGNIALNLTMQRRHLPIAYMIAIGNMAVTGIHDCIDALSADSRVSAIGLHLEGLRDIPAFAQAARQAARRGIPIVVLKTGSSEIGAQLTSSHTMSLAGSDARYGALFERLGIARLADLGQFLETLKLLHACGPLPGRRLGAMACSGGDAALLADLGQHHGLEFPRLGEDIVQSLAQTLGPLVPINNPLDYQTYIWGDVARLTDCFAAMMRAGNDASAIVLDFPAASQGDSIPGWDEVVDGFVAAHAREGGAALMTSSMPELMPALAARRLLAAGIAPMQGLGETVVAVAAAAHIGARREAAAKSLPLAAPTLLRAGSIVQLDEAAAKAALAQFGLRVPPGARVPDAPKAAAAAQALGYPVAVKALSATLAHKSELSAVKLNLRDADEVQDAVRAMQDQFSAFLVERMVSGAIGELLIGVTRDEQFGLALTIGAGGVLVELLDDTATLLLPASRAEIEQALRALRCFRLFDGFRSRPRASIPAILDALDAIVAYAQAHADRLLELEVNPLIVTPETAVGADALIRMVSSQA